ncbi:putative stage IV sporulation protein YqfD [Caloramator mitchellensis]|uniref:Putative stage IV sporulation protein YqfD n=1 Tax=Caloramator mitchellensis TaxID=908809 RepID=A0A0R3K090_CALMK|nr:sporulation protein YqfD [Caloramator mitchellensis]KRQ86652.1 putative stage IV sporulation protein YqfD [Caloramator mitchellensis]
MNRNYINVVIEGLNPEKFINLAIVNGINLWDIERISFTEMGFKMSGKQFKDLRKIAKKTSCRVRIARKNGIIFIIKRMARRAFFIAGILVFFIILYLMSNMVWSIEIEGNKKINEQIIFNELKKNGITIGSFKSKIKPRDVEKNMVKAITELSMITISFDGTKAKVRIVERTMPPEIIDNELPTNIIATKEGIITKVSALKGQALVKEGDFVKKDQVLISGVITDSQNLPLKATRAIGDVYAKTWYESIKEINLQYKYFEFTGNELKVIYILTPNNKRIYLKPGVNKFQFYDKIEEKEKIKIAGFGTNIIKITETYKEKIQRIKILNYREALDTGIEITNNELEKKVPKDAKVLEKKIEKVIMKNKVRVRNLWVTEEKVSAEKKIN